MLTNIVIILSSLVLLIYWFRYSCLVILNTKASCGRADDSVGPLWAALALGRRRVEAVATPGQLDELSSALDRDYRLLTYLLKHTAGLEIGGLTIEQRMLMLDFRLMQLWYRLSRTVFPPQSRKALAEMSDIVACFADALLDRNPQAIRSAGSA